MATPRSIKSRLSFGLVSCDIALFKTVGEAEKPKPWATPPRADETEHRVEGDVRTDASVVRTDPLADEPMFSGVPHLSEGAPEKPRKGILNAAGEFVDLTDEIEEIAERTKLEEMRIGDFIRTEQIQRGRILGSYFVAPDGPGAGKVIRLLHEALRETKRVGVVKLTKRSKQTLAVLIPLAESKALEVIELAWAEDLREVPAKCETCAQVDVTEEEINLAVDLVTAMSSTRADSLDTLTDDARQLRRDLILKAEAGATFSLPERPEMVEGGEVIELMRRGLDDRDALAAAAA
jgi:non-homologous end joining protein Ku